MGKLVARIGAWTAMTALAVLGGLYAYRCLHEARYPVAYLTRDLLKQRLGKLTPAQQALVDQCAREYPNRVLVAAYRGGRSGVENLHRDGPTTFQTITALGLKAARCGPVEDRLDLDAAKAFANSSYFLVRGIQATDSKYADELLRELQGLSPQEYRNVGIDPSYLIIARRLESRFRDDFRKNQEVLTPILLQTAPTEWNGIMGDFVAAQPRVTEILTDPQMGIPYGMTYMLHRQAVDRLLAQGVGEREAIEFVGVNAPTITETAKEDPAWAARAAVLRHVSANGRDLVTVQALWA